MTRHTQDFTYSLKTFSSRGKSQKCLESTSPQRLKRVVLTRKHPDHSKTQKTCQDIFFDRHRYFFESLMKSARKDTEKKS